MQFNIHICTGIRIIAYTKCPQQCIYLYIYICSAAQIPPFCGPNFVPRPRPQHYCPVQHRHSCSGHGCGHHLDPCPGRHHHRGGAPGEEEEGGGGGGPPQGGRGQQWPWGGQDGAEDHRGRDQADQAHRQREVWEGVAGEWRSEKVAVKVFETKDIESWEHEQKVYHTNMLHHESILHCITCSSEPGEEALVCVGCGCHGG